jgi:hypothetical protein
MAAPANPQYATLTPNQVATLDFTSVAGGVGAVVKVITDGAVSNRVYFTADGTTPVADQAGTWCLLGGQVGYKVITLTSATAGAKQVKVISAGAAWVCAEVYTD